MDKSYDKRKVNGEYSESIINEGIAFLLAGQKNEAIDVFSKVTEDFPMDYRGWLGLCLCYQPAKANHLNKALRYAPEKIRDKIGDCDVIPIKTEFSKKKATILLSIFMYLVMPLSVVVLIGLIGIYGDSIKITWKTLAYVAVIGLIIIIFMFSCFEGHKSIKYLMAGRINRDNTKPQSIEYYIDLFTDSSRDD